MGLQHSYGKGPHNLQWAGLRVACGQVTVSGITDRLNYCVILCYVHNLQLSPWLETHSVGGAADYQTA